MLVLFFKLIPSWFLVQLLEMCYEMLILILNSFWLFGMFKENLAHIFV